MGRLKDAGVVLKKYVLDNEISASVKDLIRNEYNMQIELVPPGYHWRNAVEAAIHDCKYHFLSILVEVVDNFSLYLWDRLLPQAKITLNILRQLNAMPKVSAYAHMCGPFDYNKIPVAPMGQGSSP